MASMEHVEVTPEDNNVVDLEQDGECGRVWSTRNTVTNRVNIFCNVSTGDKVVMIFMVLVGITAEIDWVEA